MRCPNCGYETNEEIGYCPQCGQDFFFAAYPYDEQLAWSEPSDFEFEPERKHAHWPLAALAFMLAAGAIALCVLALFPPTAQTRAPSAGSGAMSDELASSQPTTGQNGAQQAADLTSNTPCDTQPLPEGTGTPPAEATPAGDGSGATAADVSSPAAPDAGGQAPAAGQPAPGDAAAAAAPDEHAQLRANAEAQGKVVLTGTTQAMTGTDLANLEGEEAIKALNPAYANTTVIILALDAPVTKDVPTGDSAPAPLTFNHIVLGQDGAPYSPLAPWNEHVGQRICVAGDELAAMPAGIDISVAPFLEGLELLYVE